ncbi:MAG: SPOR domain-containing protein [Bacteroidetes bacterium]|nr:SPOR domain-containing protein [Bacteroidota bacterium]MCL1968146.1 SPOR domain-containing protein [Bacteroidota bacterium]
MKRSGLSVLLLFLFTLCAAQSNVSCNIENEINILEQQYIDVWKKIKKIEGFRIQITSFSGINSKTSIENVAKQFKQLFPDIPCYTTYSEPNFRLRVGNFRTKIEAYKALQKIVPSFTGAFVLKDLIEFKEP